MQHHRVTMFAAMLLATSSSALKSAAIPAADGDFTIQSFEILVPARDGSWVEEDISDNNLQEGGPQHQHFLQRARAASGRGRSAAVAAAATDAHSDTVGPGDNFTDALKEGYSKALEGAKAVARAAGKTLEKVSDVVPAPLAGADNPLMGRIDKMHAQMCWNREDLYAHAKCLKFLGLKCRDQSTGTGICELFKAYMKDLCDNVARDDYCSVAIKLGVYEDTPEESAIEEVVEDTAQGGLEHDDKPTLSDLDGDGIVDGDDPDIDGDGYKNEKDAFPRNAAEWGDLDGDGIGDNSDEDMDGDGVPNKDDSHPDDSSRAYDHDADFDTILDRDDAFPEDPDEWSDLDKDGIGDNSDPDIDGDGVPNDQDTHPTDPRRSRPDRDDDGYPDDADTFPDDPTEWMDSDGDGVGDNADADPHDPDCWKKPCKAQVPGSRGDKMLPDQGYDEHSDDWVKHINGETRTDDWGTEWPHTDALLGRQGKQGRATTSAQRFPQSQPTRSRTPM